MQRREFTQLLSALAVSPGQAEIALITHADGPHLSAYIEGLAKTPELAIKRLSQEITRTLNQPETKEKVFSSGQEIVAGSPQELAAYLRGEMARIGKVIKDAGIRAED